MCVSLFDFSYLQPSSAIFRCFDKDSKGLDGAADLLEVLGHSPNLETLMLDRCAEIPLAAWQRVPSGAWPKLGVVYGVPEEEKQRVVETPRGLAESQRKSTESHGKSRSKDSSGSAIFWKTMETFE